MAEYFVYILTNAGNTVLYTGVTNDLRRRLHEHRQRTPGAFATRYRCTRLAWFESGTDVASAIAREKQIKAGSRAKKLALIRTMNPDWRDLAEDWEG